MSPNQTFHKPVMLKEAIEYLNIQKNGWYIDCNLGGAGHTEKILDMGGKVLGIDMDQEAIRYVASKFNLDLTENENTLDGISDNLIITKDNFSNLKNIVEKFQIKNIKGIMFDLGVSSYQIDNPDRGFSFNTNGPLDMRMDPSLGVLAKDLVNGLNEGELTKLFTNLGEEKFAKAIARKIVEQRYNKPFETTRDLAAVVSQVIRANHRDKIHPATRVFQALRIAINDELNTLKEALPQAFEMLEPGGRLVVISFHSLEDRIVKNYFKSVAQDVNILTEKPVGPSDEEMFNNPRSRSAKMRAFQKLN